MAPPLLCLGLGCVPRPAPPPPTPPLDTPAWSTAARVPLAPLDVVGERAIAIDLPGGALDQLLADPDVTTVLTDRFSTIFLHPRARPELTARFGWPSLTAVDGDGCVRATALHPADAAALLAALNQALRNRRDEVRLPLPPQQPRGPIPGGSGVWTTDDPKAALPFVDPVRGAPALVWEGRPWIFGNRRDAEILGDAPAARAFLARLPDGAASSPDAAPALRCPLPPASSGG
jgi:hypothetical protein